MKRDEHLTKGKEAVRKKKTKEQKEAEKRRKSASKPTNPINQVRGVIGNHDDWRPLWRALDDAKASAQPHQYFKILQLASASPLLGTAYAASRPVRSAPTLQAINRLDPVAFFRELHWACLTLVRSGARLSEYVQQRDLYNAALLTANYGGAMEALEKIDRACGVSLWSVEQRLALLALRSGFESQKSYLREITDQYRRTFVGFFATNVSERNESRVSLRGFENRLRARAKTWDIKPDRLTYIFYKLLGVADESLLTAATLLAYEGASSTVDLYETLIDVLALIKENGLIRKEEIRALIKSLVAQIPDHCLKNLAVLYGEPVATPVGDDLTEDFLDLFLEGSYAQAAHAATDVIEWAEDPMRLVAFAHIHGLGAVSYEDDSVQGLARHLVEQLSEFYSYSEKSEAAAEELAKTAINFRSLPIASALMLIAEAGHAPTWLPMSVATAVRSRRISHQSLSRLAKAGAPQSDSASWQYEQLRSGLYLDEQTPSLLSLESTLFSAYEGQLATGRTSDALNTAHALASSQHPRLGVHGAILVAWALYTDGAILESLTKCIEVSIRVPGSTRMLPLERIISTRGFRDLKEMQAELSLSIAFSLYMDQTGDRSKEVALQVAWKQLLKFHIVDRPSQLRSKASYFDHEELTYFLRRVCTQDVMELGQTFGSAGDLDEERLRICVLLTDIDPDRALEYNSEILELTRRISIEEGVKQVESSRVYVDTFGVERWAREHLEEPFLRYMDYVSAGLEASVVELEKKLKEIIKKGGKSKEISDFLADYDVSADSILSDVIARAADAFMTLPRYGLDAFLGSRVRHGSLEGGFRSPLEYRRLVTKIEAKTSEYQTNQFWADLWAGLPDGTHDKIDRALKRFSKEVDGLIDKAVTRYVYVRTDHSAEGLIALWPSEDLRRQLIQHWIIDVKVHLGPDAEIVDLIAYCVSNFFWPTLNYSLQRMQRFITEDLAGGIKNLLGTLQAEVSAVVPSDRMAGFNSHIRAAEQETTDAANVIAKWFVTPEKPQHQMSFTLKTAFEIGLESTKRIRPHFHPVVSWEVGPEANVVLRAGLFEVINDIAFLIFGNVSKHSGFPETGSSSDQRPGINIAITLAEERVVTIHVESDIGVDADEAQIRHNIELARQQIMERRYDEVARKRRGTGLVRLASTFNYENSSDKRVEFGLSENRRFSVNLVAPIYYFSLDERVFSDGA